MQMNKTPTTLTNAEAEILLTFIQHNGIGLKASLLNIRNYAIATLMLDAGLRVGEVANLLQSDITIAGLAVTAVCLTAQVTKNGTERTVPLSQRCKKAIETLAGCVWIADKISAHLFAFYESDSSKPISVRQIERMIKFAGKMALNRPIHPHILRHTFATRMMRVTSIRIVQQLLGHKSLQSTQVYTHPNQDDLSNAIHQLDVQTDPKIVDKL